MKSMLFDRAQYEDLLDQADLSMLIEVLLNSPYGHEMAEALTRFQGAAAVEEAVSRNLAENYRRLVALCRGREEIGGVSPVAVFFERWDLIAAKSLLRARHAGLHPRAAMAVLVPGPGMGVALLRELAEREDMEGLVHGLAAWNPALCAPLVDALAVYAAERDVSVLEERLDRSYFVEQAARLTEPGDDDCELLRHVLQMEIDRINLRIVFRSGDDARAARLVEGGTLSRRTLQGMADAPSAAEAMEFLGNTAYRELVEGLFQFLQSARFSPLERLFDLFIITYLKRIARVRVLSLAVLMHYAWLKYNEVMNLRLIAQGEARHLPRGRIREELVYA
ncbi:MAG: V-type ATPase subunit [Candidatus Hydrogenedentes bacterium]|nr:V-type ATPase subunit [Candidatus Hydrogenedentota bacterium]